MGAAGHVHAARAVRLLCTAPGLPFGVARTDRVRERLLVRAEQRAEIADTCAVPAQRSGRARVLDVEQVRARHGRDGIELPELPQRVEEAQL